MNERTNCLNCGSPLHYDETSYGSTAKCEYCGTEYHIDKLGRVEEYKVKIKIQGKIVDFYIGEMRVEYNPMLDTTPIYIDYKGRTQIVRNENPTIKLELISYNIEEMK